MKIYEVKLLDGQVVSMTGPEYNVFMEANGLDRSHMNKTLNGKAPSAKGFVLLRRYSINYERATAMSSIELKAYKSATVSRDQANELRKMVRSNARFEWLKDEVIKSIESFNISKPLIHDVVIKENGNRTGLAVISDWHVGLDVKNHWNKFNLEVLKTRVSEYVAQVIDNGMSDGISKLVVFNLGDVINGLISTSVRMSSSLNVTEQVIVASELISEMLFEFSKHFSVSYCSTPGNHSRMSPNKKDNVEGESFGILINEIVKCRLKYNKNIEFIDNIFDESLIYVEIFGSKIFASHGDKEKITTVIGDYASFTKIVPDYVILGHLHHKIIKEVNGAEIIVCPSMSGADDYSVSLRKASKTSQLYLLFDDNGIVKEERIRFSV